MHQRRLWTLWAAIAVILVIQGTAVAQDQNQNRRGRNRGVRDQLLRLLGEEKVQDHLKLSDEQLGAVEKISEEVSNEGRERRGGRRNFRNLSDEERQKLREEAQKRAQEIKKKLAGALSEKQMNRLSEIAIQERGASALNNPDVAAKLKLTDDQKKKLVEVGRENRQKMRAAFSEGRGGDRQAMREKFTKLREEAHKALLAVLTKDQQAQFEKMKGEKFDLPQRRRGGGRRGRRPSNDT